MLSCSLGQRHEIFLRQELGLRLLQNQGHYNTIGDLELYSLHKIKKLLKTLLLNENLKKGLFLSIVEQNNKYRQDTNSERFCITSQHLFDAICNLEKVLIDKIGRNKKIDQAIKTIVEWFDDNYDDLLYDTSGKIPWPIVCMLRNKLKLWILNIRKNPFDIDLEEAILDTAKQQGYNFDRVHEAWEAMGGKLYPNKEE